MQISETHIRDIATPFNEILNMEGTDGSEVDGNLKIANGHSNAQSQQQNEKSNCCSL